MANTSGLESFLGIASSAEWTAKHGAIGGSWTVSSGNGRNGGNSSRNATNGTLTAIFDAAASGFAGAACKFSTLASNELFDVRDATVTHLTFQLNANGSITIRRGIISGTVLATSAAGVIVAGQYPYIEYSWTIDDTVGAAEVKVNGVSVVSVTGADTRNTGTATATFLRWFHQGASDITDLYYNQSGYWGDIRVEMLKPTAEGNASDWTPLSGTDNALMVDDQTPDDDTTYVSSGTAGHKDTHVTENLVSTGGTVQAVQCVARVRKDDAGARSIVTVARLSGTETDSGVVTVATTYGYARDVRTTKPGGGAWSIADVNSAEFGYKVNA